MLTLAWRSHAPTHRLAALPKFSADQDQKLPPAPRPRVAEADLSAKLSTKTHATPINLGLMTHSGTVIGIMTLCHPSRLCRIPSNPRSTDPIRSRSGPSCDYPP